MSTREDAPTTINLLVVDDDVVDRMQIRRILNKSPQSYAIYEATTYEEGLSLFKQHHFHCVLVDYLLPDRDGKELVQALRQIDEFVPIIVITGHGSEELVCEIMRLGASDYIVKSKIDEDMLPKNIEYTIRQSDSRRKIQMLSTFPEYAPIPIWEISPSGQITYANRVAQQILRDIPEPVWNHPLFEDLPRTFPIFRQTNKWEFSREVRFGKHVFLEFIVYVPANDVLRIYAIDISEQKKLEEQLTYRALHDPLTGLPNRNALMQHISQYLERARRDASFHFALLFLDLDRFKIVNDSLGHLFGDKILMDVAQRLKENISEKDILSRFGGDEFIILTQYEHDATEVVRLAEKILRVFDQPFFVLKERIYTPISIGIALSSSRYESPEELLRDADIAMYRAKTLGGNQFMIFGKDMHRHTVERFQTENELRQAIQQNNIRIVLQPIIQLATEDIVGFEILARWTHPIRGPISPATFIGIAEESGLIAALGEWVFIQALQTIRAWQDRWNSKRPIRLNINISNRQFRDDRFIEFLIHNIQQFQIDTRRFILALELTESAVMEDAETSKLILSALKGLGTEIHIDDFGTGYSSLTYLKKLPIDVLKIDRSFIISMIDSKEDYEIIRAIISMAHNLEKRVTAEGVEREIQAKTLLKLGCDFAQGYFFYPPMSPKSVEEVLIQHEMLRPSKHISSG